MENKEEINIIADIREKNSLVIAELIENNIKIEIKNIPIGDYIVGDIIIERKTISDFIASLLNKRIIRQLKELKQYDKKILIVEGYEEQDIYNKINENAIRGFILSIVLDYNIPIIMTKNYKDTANFLIVLGKRTNKKFKEISLRFKKKSVSKKEQLQFILEGFPGIGPASAKKLLKKFGTIKNVINSNKEELEEVIGKKSEIFLNLINSQYDLIN